MAMKFPPRALLVGKASAASLLLLSRRNGVGSFAKPTVRSCRGPCWRWWGKAELARKLSLHGASKGKIRASEKHHSELLAATLKS